MGIRIHKMLGYGLYDLEADIDHITDKRINIEKFEKICEKLPDFHFFMRSFKKIKKPEERLFTSNIEEKYFSNTIIYDPEYGFPNVMCFIPPDKTNSWFRYDCMIDHYDCLDQQEPTYFKLLNHGIHPYDLDKYNLLTGEKLTSKQYLESRRKLKFTNNSLPLSSVSCELFNLPEYSNLGDLRKIIGFEIPELLRHYLKWVGIFNDEKTIDTLKPMIYVYWS